MKRMNFRYLFFAGGSSYGFSSKVYIVGVRSRTVYYAHGACDLVKRRVYPKWLQHGKKVFQTELLAREHATAIIDRHLERDYTNLKPRQKPIAEFTGRRFQYERSNGETHYSVEKNLSK